MNKHKIFATAAAVLLSLTASAQTKLNNTTNAAKIMLPGDTITLGYNNDFAVVPINATCDYTVNSPETWVKVQKDANGNLAMFSEFNVSGVDRYATVTLTSIDSSYTAQFVMACEYFPRFSASATAFTGFSSAIGGMCFNALAGQVAQRVNFLAAMCIPVVALLITFLVLITTKRIVERADSGEEEETLTAQ